MADVFISYSKEDRSVAEALAADLTADGIAVWWDAKLYAGENFPDAILAALDAAMAVVVIWSTAAARSPWVRDEAKRALRQKKLLTTCVPTFDLQATGGKVFTLESLEHLVANTALLKFATR